MLLQVTLFGIFINKALGASSTFRSENVLEYNPDIYNIGRPSGLKYRVILGFNSCKKKAQAEQKVTFHYILSFLEGGLMYEIFRTNKTHPTSHALGIHMRMPAGKFSNSKLYFVSASIEPQRFINFYKF